MRIPRKKKKKIPKGHNCCIDKTFNKSKASFEHKKKVCPFFVGGSTITFGFCKLKSQEIVAHQKVCDFNKNGL